MNDNEAGRLSFSNEVKTSERDELRDRLAMAAPIPMPSHDHTAQNALTWEARLALNARVRYEWAGAMLAAAHRFDDGGLIPVRPKNGESLTAAPEQHKFLPGETLSQAVDRITGTPPMTPEARAEILTRIMALPSPRTPPNTPNI